MPDTNTKKHVLIVDDDPSILEVTTIILEEAGFHVQTAVDSTALYKIIDSQLPHVILLDIRIAGEDGAVIAEKLKSNKATQQIPLIMLSADSATKDIVNRVRADDFLEKPFELDDLLKIVKKYVRA